MKTPNEVMQTVKEKNELVAKELKVSSCCRPTCCGGLGNKKEENRKEQ